MHPSSVSVLPAYALSGCQCSRTSRPCVYNVFNYFLYVCNREQNDNFPAFYNSTDDLPNIDDNTSFFVNVTFDSNNVMLAVFLCRNPERTNAYMNLLMRVNNCRERTLVGLFKVRGTVHRFFCCTTCCVVNNLYPAYNISRYL